MVEKRYICKQALSKKFTTPFGKPFRRKFPEAAMALEHLHCRAAGPYLTPVEPAQFASANNLGQKRIKQSFT